MVYRFVRRAFEVQATQVGPSGYVQIGRKKLLGNVGTWVVVDAKGERTVWTNPEFRATFEPADEEATKYLEKAVLS